MLAPTALLLALTVLDVGRPYVGPTESDTAIEPPPELIEPTAPVRTPAPRSDPKPVAAPTFVDAGSRWRLASTVGVSGFFTYGEAYADGGVAFNGFVGAGVPVKQSPRRRIRHAFGYAGDVALGVLGIVHHAHRVAGSGIVGRRVRDEPRQLALYWFAAAGAAVLGGDYAGPSLGARIGLASAKRLEYIITLGGDLDMLVFPSAPNIRLTPTINLSLLTFGSL